VKRWQKERSLKERSDLRREEDEEMKKMKKMDKSDWISIATGAGIAGFLPLVSEKYAQWENGIIISVNTSTGAWTGLLKNLAEKTDWTKQADVDKFNNRVKLTQALVVGALSTGYAFVTDSILDKKIYFNPGVLGLSFALGAVIRYAVPNPKRIPMTVSEPVNPYV